MRTRRRPTGDDEMEKRVGKQKEEKKVESYQISLGRER